MSGINLGGKTEASLVLALKQKKQDALSTLYNAYAPVLLGVISRIVQQPEVAEEVLKETFVAIWSRIGIYDASKDRFLTWGLAIARGIALEAVKTGKYHSLAESAENRTFAMIEENLKKTLQEDVQVRQAFCQLEPKEKEILDLLYIKGVTCSEAAAVLEISIEELKTKLKLAFKHLGVEKAA